VVRKLPSGRWQASYWHEGERHVARETFATKTDALTFLSTKKTGHPASKEPVKKQAVPTVAEVEALASAVPEPYPAMVLMAAWCGLRFGELAAPSRHRSEYETFR